MDGVVVLLVSSEGRKEHDVAAEGLGDGIAADRRDFPWICYVSFIKHNSPTIPASHRIALTSEGYIIPLNNSRHHYRAEVARRALHR